VQRLVLLQIAPVDDDQRFGDTGEQHPRQRSVDGAAVALEVAVVQQPVGPLDAVTQLAPAAKTSPDLG